MGAVTRQRIRVAESSVGATEEMRSLLFRTIEAKYGLSGARVNSLFSTAVSICFGANFSGEGAVDVDEITAGQNHANDPPDEADL
jgi:hypothetical protein